jgi:phosphoglycerate dehydrogenase-like enzyme
MKGVRLVVDRPPALLVMHPDLVPKIFPSHTMHRLRELVRLPEVGVNARFDAPDLAECLPSVEVLITGWFCPPIDAGVLRSLPALKTVVHTAGSVKALLSEDFWARDLPVSSAADANAVPVAEYTLAAILWSGKGVFGSRERYRADRDFAVGQVLERVGNFGLTVGIVGASRIGRRVMSLLRPFDIQVYLTDPHVDDAAATALGATLVDLDTLVSTCDVISVHAPAIPETQQLIDEKRLALMRDGAVLINTARGSLVDTAALTRELVSGRISAVLDVTEPEPLPAESPLYDLPNLVLTPHVAGSHGNELGRLGETVVAELQRFVAGESFRHQVRRSDLHRQA